jgi:hypothetical protein
MVGAAGTVAAEAGAGADVRAITSTTTPERRALGIPHISDVLVEPTHLGGRETCRRRRPPTADDDRTRRSPAFSGTTNEALRLSQGSGR